MFQLDLTSHKSIYEQVVDKFKELIMTDVLPCDAKLPSGNFPECFPSIPIPFKKPTANLSGRDSAIPQPAEALLSATEAEFARTAAASKKSKKKSSLPLWRCGIWG